MTEEEVLAKLQQAVTNAGSLKAFGALHGLSAAYISDVLRGNRALSDTVLKTIYVKKYVQYIVSYVEKEKI